MEATFFPKPQFTVNGLHGGIPQKIELFMKLRVGESLE
jgi:hypothetical protein